MSATHPCVDLNSTTTVVSDTVDKEDDLLLLERRSIFMLDVTVLPIVTLLYLLSFMDRSNIGNARIAGMQHDLNLTDRQYQICVSILYVTYMLSELPGNLLLRTIGARIMLPGLVVTWGIVVILQGFVKSCAGLIIIRLVLGALEGPIYPGIILYLSGFYTRQELSLRLASFYSAASVAGAFSGLLAAGLVRLDGIGGRPGWSWIFILEGIITVVIGLLGFYLIPNTLSEARFLSQRQKDVLIMRLERSRTHTICPNNFSFKEIYISLTSPHQTSLYIAAFMIGSNNLGIANFLPSIVKQLGYTPTTSQLLTVGPYAATFVVTLIAAYLSDRYSVRSIPMLVLALTASVGYLIYLTSHHQRLSYASLFLIVSGSYPLGPLVSCWMANNAEPHYRRATAIALGTMFSSCGGILSTWRFPTTEAPRFTKATIMNMCFALSVAVLTIINAGYLYKENNRKRMLREQILAPYEDEKGGYDDSRAWCDLGDRHPDFHYVL